MNERGGFFKIVGVIFLVLLLLIGGLVVYLYYFHVFETVRVCIGQGEDTGFSCTSSEYCLNLAESSGVSLDQNLEGAPDFLKEGFNEIFSEAIYCEENCFIRNVQFGIDSDSGLFQQLSSCAPEETEKLFEIHGKEAIAVALFMKDQGNSI